MKIGAAILLPPAINRHGHSLGNYSRELQLCLALDRLCGRTPVMIFVIYFASCLWVRYMN
jgi:hypothetical protein